MSAGSAQTSKPRLLRLIIYPSLIEAFNTDINARFGIRQTFVQDENGSFALEHYRNPVLSPNDALEIIVVEDQQNYRRAELPARISRRVIEYFKSGAPCEPFDCNGFVHFIYEVPFKFCDFDFLRWQLLPYQGDASISPGDAVLLGHSRRNTAPGEAPVFKTSTHLGIYLMEGLYLSKFGTDSGLMVTNMDAMLEGFGGDAIWVLKKI